jgi:hypothetical protein
MVNATANFLDYNDNTLGWISLGGGNVSVSIKSSLVIGNGDSSLVNVNIPSKFIVNDTTYTVTQIYTTGFQNCANLLSVVIPDTVTLIDDAAFRDCALLKYVTLPSDALLGGSSYYQNNAYDSGSGTGSGDGNTSDGISRSSSFTYVPVFFGCTNLNTSTSFIVVRGIKPTTNTSNAGNLFKYLMRTDYYAVDTDTTLTTAPTKSFKVYYYDNQSNWQLTGTGSPSQQALSTFSTLQSASLVTKVINNLGVSNNNYNNTDIVPSVNVNTLMKYNKKMTFLTQLGTSFLTNNSFSYPDGKLFILGRLNSLPQNP